jgi:tRNA modification GTPase
MSSANDSSVLSHEEPIVALATGNGPAAIAILRLTGARCHERISKILIPKSQAPTVPGRVRLCALIDPISGTAIDEPLVVFFKGPQSYTGQDTVEIFLHGGPFIIQEALRTILSQGFRLANPGEFTHRAFLNHKLDLTAAEGIKELIDATSHQQWIAARQLATGKLRATIEALRAQLIEAMAYLEAQIDFPDEDDVSDLAIGHVMSRVNSVEELLQKLVESYSGGRVASRGLRVALFGHPNAGKSTLMNELLGHERAIVSPEPGTTRDYIEAPCHIRGRLVTLVDTAGVRKAAGEIERIGIERSYEIARSADIILFLVGKDANETERAELEIWQTEFQGTASITLLTKSDLEQGFSSPNSLAISCKKGHGIDELKSRLVAEVDSYVRPLGDEAFITSARHMSAVTNALAALAKFRKAQSDGAYEEMLAFELAQGAKALNSIVGEVHNEDVLDKIFSEFCLGK